MNIKLLLSTLKNFICRNDKTERHKVIVMPLYQQDSEEISDCNGVLNKQNINDDISLTQDIHVSCFTSEFYNRFKEIIISAYKFCIKPFDTSLLSFMLSADSVTLNTLPKPEISAIMKEMKSIVSQIIKVSQQNYKRNIQLHVMNEKDSLIKVKRYKTKEEYNQDHCKVAMLFTNFVIKGTVYKEELKKHFNRIFEIMDDKVILNYLILLRKNCSEIFVAYRTNVWTEKDDLDLQDKKQMNKRAECRKGKSVIKRMNEEGVLESEWTTVDNKKEELSFDMFITQCIENIDNNEKHLFNSDKESNNKSNKNDNNMKCDKNDSNIKNDNESTNESKSNKNDKNDSKSFNKNKSDGSNYITSLVQYKKYSFFCCLIDGLFPIMKGCNKISGSEKKFVISNIEDIETSKQVEHAENIRKKLFRKKGRIGCKKVANVQHNYDYFRKEAVRITKKYKSLFDLMPFDYCELKRVKKKDGVFVRFFNVFKSGDDNEIVNDIKKFDVQTKSINSENNSTKEDKNLLHLTKTIDFIKLVYFFKLFIYLHTNERLGSFKNKEKTNNWLECMLNDNTEVENNEDMDIALKTLSLELNIRFKVYSNDKVKEYHSDYENMIFVLAKSKKVIENENVEYFTIHRN